MNTKDIHRYSHSRISMFKQCPRKHNYAYVEQIEQPESPYTLPGKLFHRCVELTLKGQDITPVLDEFKKYCMSGKLDLEPDLLEYVVTKYFAYYNKDYAQEQTVMIEEEFKDDLENDDYLVGAIDQAFILNGYLTIRDMKTTQNALKYTPDDVKSNQQLFLYIAYAETKLNMRVDAVQIDEVRLAKLQPVPLKANGKPTIDKRQLGLVTYEDYYDCLAEMGLETDKEFQPILDYLKQRGHPLFNRVTCQVLNRNVISTNAQDILEVYDVAKTNIVKYKVHGPLCNYCAYKELCELDNTMPDTQSRQAIITKIQNN